MKPIQILFSKILNGVTNTVNNANSKGIPLPMVRDPRTGTGSVTLTMVTVSFGVCLIMLAGKVTHLIGEIDYSNCLWLLGVSLSAYLGRKFQSDGKNISITDKVDNPEEKQ